MAILGGAHSAQEPAETTKTDGDDVRILVTDGDYKHTLSIVRRLGPEHEVYTASVRRFSMGGVSRWTRKNLRCPPVHDGPRYVRWLDEVVRRYGFDQIIPVGGASCSVIAEHRHRWLPATHVVLPPVETVRAALDKREMIALAERLGIPAPRSAQPASNDDIEACAESVGFPLVIKGVGDGSQVAYVSDRADLRERYLDYVARHVAADSSTPMLQQQIVGPGFGVFATYQDGRRRRIMAHQRVREYPPSGGDSACAELFADPILLELGERILDALDWHGVAMVEFKKSDEDGRYYLMEVNPKFWGSLDLALAAGCDFPGDLLRIACGEQLPELEPPSEVLRFCWPISGDIPHLAARPSGWRPVFRDWLDRSVRTNIRLSDPLPHVVEMAKCARAVARRRR
jgi:predicted ATP-grasp superfamily ATP-dependent carboligase